MGIREFRIKECEELRGIGMPDNKIILRLADIERIRLATGLDFPTVAKLCYDTEPGFTKRYKAYEKGLKDGWNLCSKLVLRNNLKN